MQALQRDLNILFQWSIDWQMVFNLHKCEHLQVSLKRNPLVLHYTINGSQIKRVSSIKYLGVIINSKITWSDHVTYISQKANTAKRCPPSVKIKCYESYVRPILEYCSTVWDAYAIQDSQKLESVQR